MNVKPKYAKVLSENSGWRWTEAENRVIRKSVGKMATAKIAEKLGRSESSTINQIYRLRLSRAFFHRPPESYTELLGKRIGHLLPYKMDTNKKPNQRVRIWCKDIRFPDAPDRSIEANSLRFGMNKGRYRPAGQGHLDKRNGYITVRRNGRAVLEHRWIMSEHIKKVRGYGLRSNETVHHGLKGRSVNTLDNLEIRRKGNHPVGHGEVETAKWLASLGWKVKAPARIAEENWTAQK